jgi:ABC-type antimicrobial peptide transport system permease subunit
LGFVLGGVGIWALINLGDWNPKPDFFPIFKVPDAAMYSAVGIAVLTGVLSGIVPGLAALRLKAAAALRSI